MTLVLLYGPPAAGKLTVARRFAERTGFRLFHNHLSIDLAHEIFPERDADYGDLVARIRLDVFEAAARAGVSLISTFVYAAESEDDAFLAKIEAIFTEQGGNVVCVGLYPSREALRQRVVAPSRSAYAKIKEWSVLEGLLDSYDLVTPIAGSLTIDNTDLSPDEVAARIVVHLGLAP